jgi:UDP-glucose 4-epimerase
VLWGKGREVPATLGQRAGPVHVVIGAGRQLPAVHVDNCADAFARAALSAAGGTFNVVDEPVTAARFVRDHLRRSGRGGVALPAAYRPALAAVAAVHRLTPAALRSRLPAFVSPERFAARYRPVRVDGTRLREALRWTPPFSYEQCLDRTYPGTSGRAA